MSQINVDIIASQSTGDVTVNDPLKVDVISPVLADDITIQNALLDVVFKYETLARHIKIGSGVTSSQIGDSVSVGYQSMNQCVFNSNGPAVAIGSEALKNGVAPGSNIAIGFRSLLNADGSTGINNQAIGNLSGSNLISGGNNIILGHNAQAATTSASNSITLGNSSHTVIRAAVTTITSLSDERDKKDIKDLSTGLEFVETLRPVEFTWNDRDENGRHDIADFGFIAQDLKKAQEDAEKAEVLKLVYEENPEKLEASYGKLIPILVKAIQELSEEVKQLKNK